MAYQCKLLNGSIGVNFHTLGIQTSEKLGYKHRPFWQQNSIFVDQGFKVSLPNPAHGSKAVLPILLR